MAAECPPGRPEGLDAAFAAIAAADVSRTEQKALRRLLIQAWASGGILGIVIARSNG